MKRENYFINGYEYWFEISKRGIMVYDSETSVNGISTENIHWTKDELKQIKENLEKRGLSHLFCRWY